MTKIQMQFSVQNEIFKNKFLIFIYNDKCRLIIKDIINTYENKVINLKPGIYKLKIVPENKDLKITITSFIVKEHDYTLSLEFVKPMTFKLIDKFYNNLPIEKGVIELWQNHIQ